MGILPFSRSSSCIFHNLFSFSRYSIERPVISTFLVSALMRCRLLHALEHTLPIFWREYWDWFEAQLEKQCLMSVSVFSAARPCWLKSPLSQNSCKVSLASALDSSIRLFSLLINFPSNPTALALPFESCAVIFLLAEGITAYWVEIDVNLFLGCSLFGPFALRASLNALSSNFLSDGCFLYNKSTKVLVRPSSTSTNCNRRCRVHCSTMFDYKHDTPSTRDFCTTSIVLLNLNLNGILRMAATLRAGIMKLEWGCFILFKANAHTVLE